MSKFILSAKDQTEIYVSGISTWELLELSNKTFVSKYGHKSKTRVIQDAKDGNEKNYKLVLRFQTGSIIYQFQSIPIIGEKVKELGFSIDEIIEKYEDIGGMLRKLENSR